MFSGGFLSGDEYNQTLATILNKTYLAGNRCCSDDNIGRFRYSASQLNIFAS